MPSIKVSMTEFETTHGAMIGIAQNIVSMFAKRKHRWNPKRCDRCGQPRGGWRSNIEGKIGEMAFCKGFHLYWTPILNTFKKFGDQWGVEIKTRSLDHYQLFVRPDDHDDRPYVLVRGETPSFEIVGWMMGRDAKHEEWLKDHGNEGKPAYFVPDRYLSDDWAKLRDWIREHRQR